jgi:hypothetical protein
MITKERIIEKYKSMDDSQILDLHRTTHTLSDLGREALADVLKERGGIEKLIADRNKSIEIEREKFNLNRNSVKSYVIGFKILFMAVLTLVFISAKCQFLSILSFFTSFRSIKTSFGQYFLIKFLLTNV